MGYDTYFNGRISIEPPLSRSQEEYLKAFSSTRRMKRDPELTAQRSDPLRELVGLPVGPEGGYFVGAGGHAGQEDSFDILDYNNAPTGQPGLWCKWTISVFKGKQFVEWNEREKFYDYTDWLHYLVKHFFEPWGITLNGLIEWQGEDSSDRGQIVVKDNQISIREGRWIWDAPVPFEPGPTAAERVANLLGT